MRGRILYVTTPLNRVLALDPGSGSTLWTFDPQLKRDLLYPEGLTSRGVAVWVGDSTDANASCSSRVLVPTVDARLIALDARSGAPCEEFGERGTVHLARGAGIAGTDVSPAHLSVTSPPAIAGELVIVGSTGRDRGGSDRPSGVVRAFDVRSGALVWAFDPIPRRPGDSAWVAWSPEAARSTVGANVWSVISVDVERDLVFLPTSSASPNFYGGDRPGRNDFANSIVALRASTGRVVWSFQVVHHDLWDYDVAAQPVLARIRRGGTDVPVVIVGTKTGMIFVLDRETGVPIYPVEERAVPPSDVPGELAWPTQPFSLQPLPLLGTRLTPDSAFGADAADRAFCREAIAALRADGIFTPPSLHGTLVWPGFWGGINWDGMAWDPGRQRLVTTLKRVAMVVKLHKPDDAMEPSTPGDGREFVRQVGAPYAATRGPLIAPSGNPCSPPPWGSILAIDLGTDATVRWKRPLGSVPWLSRHAAYRDWGSLAFGGPLITAGGLVFVAASQDDKLHAFDIDTGQLVWEHQLPAGGQATPMTYVLDGKQYVVVAAGGRGGVGTPGDWIVAFVLPD